MGAGGAAAAGAPGARPGSGAQARSLSPPAVAPRALPSSEAGGGERGGSAAAAQPSEAAAGEDGTAPGASGSSAWALAGNAPAAPGDAGGGAAPVLSAAWSAARLAAHSRWSRLEHHFPRLEDEYRERCARGAAGGGGAPPASAAPPSSRARHHADAGGLPEPMLRFAEDLSMYGSRTALTSAAFLSYGEPLSQSYMVASAAWDRDDEFFALAGVAKRIKIYEREAVLRSSVYGAHFPVLELSSRSRLSCVAWSSYIKVRRCGLRGVTWPAGGPCARPGVRARVLRPGALWRPVAPCVRPGHNRQRVAPCPALCPAESPGLCIVCMCP
jgi:hypothetical protein